MGACREGPLPRLSDRCSWVRQPSPTRPAATQMRRFQPFAGTRWIRRSRPQSAIRSTSTCRSHVLRKGPHNSPASTSPEAPHASIPLVRHCRSDQNIAKPYSRRDMPEGFILKRMQSVPFGSADPQVVSLSGYGKARVIFSPCGMFSASRTDTPCNSAIAATSDSPRPLPGLPRLVSSR